MKIADVMTRNVITVRPETTLKEAAGLLARTGISGMPVVDGTGRLAGILTRGDVLRACIQAMGVGEISSRLEVLVPDRPGALADVVAIIKTFHVNIITVLTAGPAGAGMRTIYFRLSTLNVAPIRKAIEEAGFRVLDPGSFLP